MVTANQWTKAFAQADDFDDSDNKTILTFFEAQDVAKGLTRGEHGSDDNAPITVCGALTDYRADLEARRPIPTTPNGRACISPPCCCRSRWHC